jgi:hypothetical protein
MYSQVYNDIFTTLPVGTMKTILKNLSKKEIQIWVKTN